MKKICILFVLSMTFSNGQCASSNQVTATDHDIEMGGHSSSAVNPITQPQDSEIVSTTGRAAMIAEAQNDSLTRFRNALLAKKIYDIVAYTGEISGNLIFYGGTTLMAVGTALESYISSSGSRNIQVTGLVLVTSHAGFLGFAKFFAQLSSQNAAQINNFLALINAPQLPNTTPVIIDASQTTPGSALTATAPTH